MPSPLEAAGAIRDQSEYATLTMDRFITGIWTQRSPIRDADVPYLYGKFYSASRFDSIYDGINREITARLTSARRAGSSVYNSNTFPGCNSFYPFKYIQNSSQVTRVIYDGKDGVVYDATAGQKTALFTKSVGAGKTRFLGVNTKLFFTNGTDLKKLIRSSYVWSAGATWVLDQFIIDSNLNIQRVTTAGVAGGTEPAWATTIGATTTDGGVTWTCYGISVQNWQMAAPTAAPTVANAVTPTSYPGWSAATFFLADDFLLDSNGNLQLIFNDLQQTGTTPPSWSTSPGALTTDNTALWLCVGASARLTNHNYFAGVTTSLLTPVTGLGSQTVTVASTANIYAGKVLLIDAGTNLEAIIVTAVNPSLNTITATFAKTHIVNVTIEGPADTIAVNYSRSYRGIIGYDINERPIYGQVLAYYTDFFQCTTPGTSSATATSSIRWSPGTGSATSDGPVVWTNIGQQVVWNNPTANPDSTVTQITLNPSAANVKVSNAFQIVDTNGNLQTVSFAGLSGATVPTWNVTTGGTTVDGASGLVWTNGGPAPTASNSLPWLYGFTYYNDITDDESAGSPVSAPITLNNNSVIVVQGLGSADPQCSTIPIYRSAKGQPTLLYLGSVPNPGANELWTFTDPATPDTQLNAQRSMPLFSFPPPQGMTAPAYHCNRIWGIVGSKAVYSDPYVYASFPSLNFVPLIEQGTRFFPCVTSQGPTMLVLCVSNVYAIFGTGTDADPFSPAALFMGDVGLLSYDAVTQVGSTYYLLSSDNKFSSLDPGAGYTEPGFPIGDQFTEVTTGGTDAPQGELYDPSTAFVTWCEHSSGDTAIYACDGAVGWFRFSPVASPESGYLWSPRAAILGGTSAVQSIEIAPGVKQLLIAPATSGPILFRDPSVNADWTEGEYQPFPSWQVKGNIVLCLSGEVAEIAHIALKGAQIGSRPTVSLLLGEYKATEQVPFDELEWTSQDPPDLPPSQTFYSDRYSALQGGVAPKCDNFQLKVDYGIQDVADELFTFSVYGAKHAERKQQ